MPLIKVSLSMIEKMADWG